MGMNEICSAKNQTAISKNVNAASIEYTLVLETIVSKIKDAQARAVNFKLVFSL